MRVAVDDIINFPFSIRTQEAKLKIVTDGKPRPFLNMARYAYAVVSTTNNETDNGELHTFQFRLSMYDEVPWLTGCEKRQSLFCWPCLLFKPAVGLWNTVGIGDLAAFLEARPKHEEAFEHILATLKLRNMLKNKAETSNPEVSLHNEIVERNRAILKRMADVVCNALEKEQPFFKRINGCKLDPENCRKSLKFLRSYDVLNCSYIEDAVDLIEISPDIINDLVNAIAKVIKMAIRKEIQQSTYVSIILSNHSKTAERSQISTILRYRKGNEVCERFIGFYNAGAQKSLSVIYSHISCVLTEFELSERFLAFAVDGGILQTKELEEIILMMKNLHPYAFFVPWYGHSLEHVLQQSLANIQECSTFFKALDEMKVFFHKKSKQFKAFQVFMAEREPSTKGVEWFVRSQFIQIVNQHRQNFVLFFDSVSQDSKIWKPDDVCKALGFRKILEDFQTVFLLKTFTKLFKYPNSLALTLKGFSPEKIISFKKDVEFAMSGLKEELSNGFEKLWSVVHLKKCDANLAPDSKKIKMDFDDPLVDKYNSLFQKIIKCMISEIDIRYNSNLDRLSFCELLIPDNITIPGSTVTFNRRLQSLMNAHGAFFEEERLRNELLLLRSNGLFKNNIYDILDSLIQSKLQDVFKYVYKLAKLILTLPMKYPTMKTNMAKFKAVRDWSYMTRITGLSSGDVSIPCVELEFLQELKKSDTFHDEITIVFQEINKTFELLHR